MAYPFGGAAQPMTQGVLGVNPAEQQRKRREAMLNQLAGRSLQDGASPSSPSVGSEDRFALTRPTVGSAPSPAAPTPGLDALGTINAQWAEQQWQEQRQRRAAENQQRQQEQMDLAVQRARSQDAGRKMATERSARGSMARYDREQRQPQVAPPGLSNPLSPFAPVKPFSPMGTKDWRWW